MIVDQKLNKGFAGVYLIDGEYDGTQLATTVKPNWFRRVMTRLFIGWKWISVLKLKELQKAAAEKARLEKEAAEELKRAKEEEQEAVRLGEPTAE
jgi:hypothetical protein